MLYEVITNRLEEEVKSAMLLFSRNKKLKDNFTATGDFLLYKKTDDILWLDWDPIGINDVAPRDEYRGYVPEIFGLVKAKADRQEIANRLRKLETENIGMTVITSYSIHYTKLYDCLESNCSTSLSTSFLMFFSIIILNVAELLL